MKVLHVITRLIAGGAQLNTLRTAILHRGAGVDSHILHGPSAGIREGDLLAEARAAEVPLHQIDSLCREPSLRHDLQSVLELVRFLHRHPFDVVHTHTSKAGFIGRLAARLAGLTAIVHTPHGHVFHSYYGPVTTRLYMLLERCAAGWAELLIALTPRERDEHLALGIGDHGRFAIVPSGIDIERFRAAGTGRADGRRRLGAADDAFVVGCVGRLVDVKGQDVLIRALPEIRRRVPRARVVLAGDGDARERLLALARDLGVGGHVDFLGRVDEPEFLYGGFDVAVVPSRNEGMGRVLLEAMAAGVPVVASEVGGIPDIVEAGKTGLLVSPERPELLAEAVAEIATDPPAARARAAAAARAVSSRYSERAMADRLLELYQQVANRPTEG